MNFDSVHNYYEQLVVREIMESLIERDRMSDEEFLQDVACVALNQLPTRYIRHDVDMAFYLTVDEREAMDQSVRQAVEEAVRYVAQRREYLRQEQA